MKGEAGSMAVGQAAQRTGAASAAGPWEAVLAGGPAPRRAQKPRTVGLTMVIDKGLSLGELEGLLELAHPFIDFLKLGFGTSALYPEGMLRRKVAMARAFGVEVYAGGTLLELAASRGRAEAFFDRAMELGFTYVEVSEGSLEFTPEERVALIRKARQRGFGVLAEVGKKDRNAVFDPSTAVRQILRDLEAGAFRVIVEGRDSGRHVGIYDGSGAIRRESLEVLASGVGDASALIWEAPLPAQQQELLKAFGPNVNLGNVQPADVVSLEATRLGLRGDTLPLVAARDAAYCSGDPSALLRSS